MRRRAFLTSAAVTSVGGLVGCAGYAWGFEPHWVEIVRRNLPIERLPDALEGASLVQISDLHVGREVDDSYLLRCLRVVGDLAPDIVVVTGDAVSARGRHDQAVFEQLRTLMAHLPQGRLGTYAILGNHDYGRAWSDEGAAARVAAELERGGARVLRNGAVQVSGLDLVGVDDLWARRADPGAALGQRRARAALVLCHNPDGLDELDWVGYRGWILAGHTHGGQCRLPFMRPPILPVRNRRYAAGEVNLADGRRLYVNRGLGHLERVRFNVRPEISRFVLLRA
jgi:predicted MPP superfamily phosphohydrolase